MSWMSWKAVLQRVLVSSLMETGSSDGPAESSVLRVTFTMSSRLYVCAFDYQGDSAKTADSISKSHCESTYIHMTLSTFEDCHGKFWLNLVFSAPSERSFSFLIGTGVGKGY
jgi:hypothetical protein